MKQCHECDSEIADNDLFCPYCGISIQGVSIEAVGSDDAFSSTIVIPSAVQDGSDHDSETTVPEQALGETEIPSEVKSAEFVGPDGGGPEADSTSDNPHDSVETSLTDESIDIKASPEYDLLPEIADDATVDNLDVGDLGMVDQLAAVTNNDDSNVEEPRIAERLTGAFGSISGRFDQPINEEIVAPDPVETDEPKDEATFEANPVLEENIEPEVVAEFSSGENVADINSEEELPGPLQDDGPTPIVTGEPTEKEEFDNAAVSIPDVPTPDLLANDVEGPSVEKVDKPLAFDSSTPLFESADNPTQDAYVGVNDSIQSATSDVNENVSEPEADLIEESTETESAEGNETLAAESDELASTEETDDRATAMGEEADVPAENLYAPPVLMRDLGQNEPNPESTPENIEVEEPPVPVTDEPLQHAAADTGDGLEGQEVIGGTKPNIGSSDTDGRKSGLKPLTEGTVLNNRYDIVRKIGGGGMGAVYLANDRNLGGVQRAVKEMVQSHIEEEQQEKAVEDFKRESMILSTLDHPSIPTIYDYFFDAQEGRFYLVMKYISGGDLAGKLRSTPEGRIDERTVTEWALQIIDVLDYLHNLPTKIVYRDLKPSNVMIDGNTGRIMLIDFGIARSINQNQEKGVTAVGTMGYAPPELFSGNVEPRSDIYSLGSTMFHLMTGADPQNNPLLIFDFQKNPRPRQINPQLSDQIERILMRAVEYNADARFASAAEMKFALAAHLENLRSGQITYGVTEVPQSVSLSHQIVFCGFCGQRIVATDMFCAFCGSKQPLAQHGVHREVYSPAVGTARLVIEGTSDLTAPTYGLEKNENLVGRRDPMSNIFPEVDLSKYDPQTKISRRHAKIWRDGGNFLVEDLGSSNGTILLTKVSDTLRLMPHQPHPLSSGDRIRIGDTTLQLIVG